MGVTRRVGEMVRSAATLCLALLMAIGMMFAGARPWAQTSGSTKPNVVVIVADDLGWSDVSTYGLKRVSTPNIDRIAKNGVAFTNGYTAASVCSVARAGLLTGRYPQRFGNEYLSSGDEVNRGLAINELTIANYMKSAGYHTGAIGKWHEGATQQFYPVNRGFDEFWGFLGGLTSYEDPSNPDVVSGGACELFLRPVRERPSKEIVTGPERTVVHNFEKYSTYEFADQASGYIARNKSDPFFLYLAFNAPHRPFQRPRRSMTGSPTSPTTLGGFTCPRSPPWTKALDGSWTRWTSLASPKTPWWSWSPTMAARRSSAPCDCSSLINAGKFTYLEGGTRIPFVMSWPKGIKQRGLIDAPVSELDILPTAVKLARGETSPAHPVDGHNLQDTIMHPDPQRSLYWRQKPIYAVREGQWKLWKSLDLKQIKLYNLATDPGELHDVAGEHPDIVAHLRQSLDAWEKGLVEPAWDKQSVRVVTICGRVTESVV